MCSAGYQHNDAANTEGTWGPAGNYDDASRLVSKFEKAHNGLIQEHVESAPQADISGDQSDPPEKHL